MCRMDGYRFREMSTVRAQTRYFAGYLANSFIYLVYPIHSIYSKLGLCLDRNRNVNHLGDTVLMCDTDAHVI